jgi:flagellar basal body-associated protein FliL
VSPVSPEAAVAFFCRKARSKKGTRMSILWIILIVILVLALLGYFGRGRRSV